MTRREAILRLGSASLGARVALAQGGVSSSGIRLAPGTPESPERKALIDSFKRQSEGIDKKFEARTHKSDAVMPYQAVPAGCRCGSSRSSCICMAAAGWAPTTKSNSASP